MKDNKNIFNPLIGVAAFVVVILGMQAASSILIPFIFAIFLAVIVWPLMKWLVSKGVPNGLSIAMVILSIVGFLVILAA
jgi:predicted PurR-regulated permease PerM